MKPEIEALSKSIAALTVRAGRPVKLMEVCGTHTVAIFRTGIRSLIPKEITLLSGPGCPVCVTSMKDVDTAIAIAAMPGVTLMTFGDMMRVPGGTGSLNTAKAGGADVRILYSPLEALRTAQAEPDRKIVFFATGFETTSPLVASTIEEADKRGIGNYYVFTVHKLVPPALHALLSSGEVSLDGLILPGHVCSMVGSKPYEFLASEYKVPSVVTGFGAPDLMRGILMLMEQIVAGEPKVEVQYRMVVRDTGNPRAVETLNNVFEPCDAYWRGIGPIPGSGLALRTKYVHRDAMKTIASGLTVADHPEPRGCSCGEVLKGKKLPTDCPLFGKTCTPQKPVGACMVSAEGSCAAYYKYGAPADV